MGSESSAEPATPPRLRPYAQADFEATVRLWYSAWHHTFPELTHPQTLEEWQARFQDELAPHDTIWVAEAERQIVGFIAFEERRGVVDQLFVEPACQGSGVGTALLGKARELVPTGLTLTTLAQNTPARRFYEQHGFVLGAGGLNPVNGEPTVSYNWRA